MSTKDVATTEQKPPTLAQLIERQKPEIARALPRHLNPDRMARIAMTTLRQTPMLARCTPESFLGALMSAAQLGLEPGPLGEAYLVPFRDNKSGNYNVTFIPGYKGLIKLAWQSGQLADIWAEVVYENDEFDYTLGLNRDLVHKPAKGRRGDAVYVYAVAKLKDGGTPFVVLAVEEVESIRSRSKASKNGPWVTDWAAMAKKTAVKQLSKWLPMSSEFASAVAMDGSTRTDVGPLVDAQTEFVDGEVVADTPAIEAGDGESGPGQGGGNDQSEGAEPSSGAAGVESDSGDQAPPADVVYAGQRELKQLKQIRAAEQHDDASWKAFVANSIGREVANDKQLTMAEAEQIIAIFNEDAGQ